MISHLMLCQMSYRTQLEKVCRSSKCNQYQYHTNVLSNCTCCTLSPNIDTVLVYKRQRMLHLLRLCCMHVGMKGGAAAHIAAFLTVHSEAALCRQHCDAVLTPTAAAAAGYELRCDSLQLLCVTPKVSTLLLMCTAGHLPANYRSRTTNSSAIENQRAPLLNNQPLNETCT
jgi:hypothetical protein